MKVILVRHGETEGNMNKICEGVAHGKLTAKGVEQTRKLARRLKDEDIDVIFSSDLGRALETVGEIARFHEAPVIENSDIREMSAGIFEGRPYSEFLEQIESMSGPYNERRVEGGESIAEARKRISRFVEMLEKNYAGKTVLVSGHFAINKVLLSTLLNEFSEKTAKIEQNNACVNVIEIDDTSRAARIINCIKHL